MQTPSLLSPAAPADITLDAEQARMVTASFSRARDYSRQFYRPELDALRFCAFLAVFLHHSIYNLFPLLSICGGFGLSFFFFLSSFLITELLQREIGLSGTISIGGFYIRRVLRIWPLYLLAIIGAVVASIFLPSHRIRLGFVLSYLFMLGNYYIARHGFPNSFICYLWSISVEEQFYLLWPILNKRLSRPTVVGIGLALIPAGSLAVLILADKGAVPALGIWTNSLVQAQSFAFGALTAFALNGRIPRFSNYIRVVLAGGGALLWLLTATFSGIDDRVSREGFAPMCGYLAVNIGCALLMLSVLGLGRNYVPGSFVYLGKISYGLYVYHQLSLEVSANLMNLIPAIGSGKYHAAFGVGHVVCGITLTVVLASVSYKFIEKPFLRLKDRYTIVRSRAA